MTDSDADHPDDEIPDDTGLLDRRVILAGIGSVVTLSSAAVAGGLLSYSKTITVSYGEVSYEQSDIDVVDISTDGPGLAIDAVIVQLKNTASSRRNATVTSYLTDEHGDLIDSAQAEVEIEGDGVETVELNADRRRRSAVAGIDVEVREATGDGDE